MARPAESQVLKKEGYEEFVIPPLEVLLTWDIVTHMEPGDAIEEVLANNGIELKWGHWRNTSALNSCMV